MDKRIVSILIGLGIFIVGSGVGYYCAPEKTKTVVVEKKVEQKNVRKHRVKITKPDGTTTTTTDTTDTSRTNEDRNTVKETSHKKQDWLIGAAVLYDLDGKRTYEGSIQRRIIGNIYVGVLGDSRGTAGLGLSLSW